MTRAVSRSFVRRLRGVLLFGGLVTLGCDRAEVKGEPPPPPPEVKKDPCARVPDETVHEIPRKLAGYCVDPESDVRAYGVVHY